jgi:agmatinase
VLPAELQLVVNESPYVFGGYSAPLERAFAVIVGAPLDLTTSYRPGSRFGPSAVRRVASSLEFYSLRLGVDVERIPVHDLGDVATTYDVAEAIRRVEKVVSFVAGRGKLPVLLGGEHTVALGALRALRERRPCVLVADAHLDLRSEYMGSKLNHATVLRRVVEELELPLVYVGVRAVSAEELDLARRLGLSVYTSYEVSRKGVGAVVESATRDVRSAGCELLYVSVDMDVLDPAYAPGVATPEPEGLTTTQLLDILVGTVVEAGIPLAGVDVVEVTPPYDVGEATAAAAAKTVIELVAAAWLVQRMGRAD